MPLDPAAQREFAVEIVRRLHDEGHIAYWAGGCVRDRLLGRAVKDYDVATDARPDRIRAIFGRRRTLAIGAAFGVMTVVGPRAAGQVEVATFREDAGYSDGRRPDAVSFSSPEADAQRRDFTINGMFFDPLTERVIDFVDGQTDLAARVVRAIGRAEERIAEDKLRMLRAVRFAATLDFAIEPQTLRAIQELAASVSIVSPERIAAELRLMLAHPRRGAAVRLLQETGLLAAVLPETSAAANWLQNLAVLEQLGDAGFPLAMAALLGECSEEPPREIGLRLRLSNKEIDRIVWLVKEQRSLDRATQAPWPELQRLLTTDGADDLLALQAARTKAGLAPASELEYCLQRRALPPEELNPPPLVTGDDLIEHGVPRGKLYAALLRQVRDAQLHKRISTKPEALALVDRLLASPQMLQ